MTSSSLSSEPVDTSSLRVLHARATQRRILDAAWAPYRVEIRPRLWQATWIEMLEVCLDQSVPEIVDDKLGLLGLTGARATSHASLRATRRATAW